MCVCVCGTGKHRNLCLVSITFHLNLGNKQPWEHGKDLVELTTLKIYQTHPVTTDSDENMSDTVSISGFLGYTPVKAYNIP